MAKSLDASLYCSNGKVYCSGTVEEPTDPSTIIYIGITINGISSGRIRIGRITSETSFDEEIPNSSWVNFDDDNTYKLYVSDGEYELGAYNTCSGSFYASSSGGGGGGPGDDSWSWGKELGSGSSSTSVSVNTSAGKISYYVFTPPSNGTLEVYFKSNNNEQDSFGWLTNGNCELGSGNGSNALIEGRNGIIYTSDDRSNQESQADDFKFTYNVSSGSKYEIDVHAYSITETLSGRLYIVFTQPITSWQDPELITTISNSTSRSGTATVNKYCAGYIRYYTPSYVGKLVIKTTSNSNSPDYYSHMSKGYLLSAGPDTDWRYAVDTSGSGYLGYDDDGAGTGRDTKYTLYPCDTSTYYYWYVNAEWNRSGTYSIPWQLNYYRQYTITFNKNDGTNTVWSTNYVYADSMTATMASAPTRTDYTFQGWSTSSSATSGYNAGSTVSVSGSTTFYAVWKINTITVTYNANGGSGGPGSQTVNTNSSFSINGSNYPTRSNYIFKGWSTSSSAKTATYKKGTTPSISAGTSNITYYAVWWPAFTWKDYSRSEANTFAGYINTYLNSSITTINDTNPLRLVIWFNAVATALENNTKVISGDASFKAQLDTLLTAYNNY